MQPLQVLLRYACALLISQFIAFCVRKGFFAAEEGAALSPLLQDVFNFYLPIVLTAVTSLAHQIYTQFVSQQMFETARQLQPSATTEEVADKALGTGNNRKAARVFLGVK